MTSLSLRGLTGKLLLGQVLVLLAGATTVVVVAFALEPGLIGSDGDGNFGPRQVLVAFGASLVVAAVIVLALSVLLSLRLVRPIREAADAAERIAQGQRGVRVSVPSSDDELAQLTDAFNRMAVSVEDGERRRAQLVADVAHELRTPLTTIDGYLEGVEDELVPADPSTWTLLRDQTARLRRLAEDLALVARVEERRVDLDLEPVSVARLIDRAAAAARPAFDVKGVTIRTNADRPAGNTRVVADAGRIGDVLANLLANALRHSNPENDVLIEATRTGDTVTITVADHGDGIAPDDLEHIFDRLYRTDQARTRDAGGSGLGLAISRAIVEAHEGTIRAESPGLGQGASLTIILPAAAAGQSTCRQSETALVRGSHQRPLCSLCDSLKGPAGARGGRGSALAVAKLGRLSRSMLDFSKLMAKATSEHWALVALDVAVDTSTPSGEAMANMLATFAQFERRLISQRTKEALAVKCASGVRLGRRRLFRRRWCAGSSVSALVETHCEGLPRA